MSDKIMAECEQLRRDKRELEQQVSSARHRLQSDYVQLKVELARAKAENERLKDQLAGEQRLHIGHVYVTSEEWTKLCAENARLAAVCAFAYEKLSWLREHVEFKDSMNVAIIELGKAAESAALRDLLAPTIEAVSLAEQWMARPKHGMPDRQAIVLTLKNELVRLSKYTHRTL